MAHIGTAERIPTVADGPLRVDRGLALGQLLRGGDLAGHHLEFGDPFEQTRRCDTDRRGRGYAQDFGFGRYPAPGRSGLAPVRTIGQST